MLQVEKFIQSKSQKNKSSLWKMCLFLIWKESLKKKRIKPLNQTKASSKISVTSILQKEYKNIQKSRAHRPISWHIFYQNVNIENSSPTKTQILAYKKTHQLKIQVALNLTGSKSAPTANTKANLWLTNRWSYSIVRDGSAK